MFLLISACSKYMLVTNIGYSKGIFMSCTTSFSKVQLCTKKRKGKGGYICRKAVFTHSTGARKVRHP